MGILLWIAALATLGLAYFVGDNLRRIQNSLLKLSALILLMLIPLTSILIWLWGDPAMGLGLAMLFPYYGGWAIASLVGYIWGKHARKVN